MAGGFLTTRCTNSPTSLGVLLPEQHAGDVLTVLAAATVCRSLRICRRLAPCVLDDAHLLCFFALLAGRHLELDLVAFVQ